jgi:Tfp pilus assembly protein PilF
MRHSAILTALLALALIVSATCEATAQGRGHHHGTWWWGSYSGGYPYVVTGPYPPAFVPANALFGPAANDQFIGGFVGFNGGAIGPLANLPAGVGGANRGAGNIPGAANGAAVNGVGVMGGQAAAGPLPADVQPRGKPRTTNAAAKVRAGKFIQFGDALFAKQKYNSALERYREAATTAPDLADCYFRECFALVASGQYESAMRSLERGLRIRPNWPDANFELATVYGPDSKLAQASHRESLASAIEQNPQSSDQLVLMGLLLYCGGARDRAQLFFARAVELGANAEHLLDRFIAPRPADDPFPPKPPGRAAKL